MLHSIGVQNNTLAYWLSLYGQKKIFNKIFLLVLIVMSDMFELIFTSIFFPAKEHLKPWSQGVCARGEILGIIIGLLSYTRIWSYIQRLLCPWLGWSHKCALLQLLKGQEYRNTEFFIFLNGRWFVYKLFISDMYKPRVLSWNMTSRKCCEIISYSLPGCFILLYPCWKGCTCQLSLFHNLCLIRSLLLPLLFFFFYFVVLFNASVHISWVSRGVAIKD